MKLRQSRISKNLDMMYDTLQSEVMTCIYRRTRIKAVWCSFCLILHHFGSFAEDLLAWPMQDNHKESHPLLPLPLIHPLGHPCLCLQRCRAQVALGYHCYPHGSHTLDSCSACSLVNSSRLTCFSSALENIELIVVSYCSDETCDKRVGLANNAL